MVYQFINVGCIVNCRSNYTGEESTIVFPFPKEEDLKKRSIRFVN